MGSFADNVQAFVPPWCFTGLGRSDTVTHMFLADLFRLVLNTFNGENELQSKEARHFWNPFIKKDAYVQDWRLQQSGSSWYSSTNQVLTNHLVSYAGQRMYGIPCIVLDVWITCLLDVCDLTEPRLHLLWFPETQERFLPSKGHVEVQFGNNDFERYKDKSKGILAIVAALEGAFLFACLGSHHFVFHPDDLREMLSEALRREEDTIPPNSGFIGHGYLQQAGRERPGK